MESTMSTDTPNSAPLSLPQRVLVAVDASKASQRAVDYLKYVVPAGAAVRFVSVVDTPRAYMLPHTFAPSEFAAAHTELVNDASNALGGATLTFGRVDVTVETAIVDLAKKGGDVVDALLDETRDWHADLLVAGSRQYQGLLRWVEGSVSEPLLARTDCAILFVPPGVESATHAPKRVLFATDGSPIAARALRYGAQFATPDTHLRAIYVIDRAVRLTDFVPIHMLEDAFVEESERALAVARQLLDEVPGQSSTAALSTDLTSDDVAHTIVREAERWPADLLVMGTHGRRGVSRWLLGSIAQRVARLTPIPLLLVHGPNA
ncbi:universal stress protein [Burkholderia pseudomallei]|uniref:universal stress protein n=1 Tax=Burkholderia pseudomallei TaxID=28450 RepID=UPI0009D62C71|nr:universal stress protein [Burkholderia pseudomallei]OMR76942.1 universal stress protein UspA [Burkholderia pseudomallei]